MSHRPSPGRHARETLLGDGREGRDAPKEAWARRSPSSGGHDCSLGGRRAVAGNVAVGGAGEVKWGGGRGQGGQGGDGFRGRWGAPALMCNGVHSTARRAQADPVKPNAQTVL